MAETCHEDLPFVSKLTWLLAEPLVQMMVVKPMAAAIARIRSLVRVRTRFTRQEKTTAHSTSPYGGL